LFGQIVPQYQNKQTITLYIGSSSFTEAP